MKITIEAEPKEVQELVKSLSNETSMTINKEKITEGIAKIQQRNEKVTTRRRGCY